MSGGIQGTLSAGTLTPFIEGSTQLTGSQGTLSAGTAVATIAIPITGLDLTGSTGSVSVENTAPEDGDTYVEMALGDAVATLAIELTGQGLTGALGTVSPNTGNITVALSGQALTAALGSIVPTLSGDLAGATLAIARGILTQDGGVAYTEPAPEGGGNWGGTRPRPKRGIRIKYSDYESQEAYAAALAAAAMPIVQPPDTTLQLAPEVEIIQADPDEDDALIKAVIMRLFNA